MWGIATTRAQQESALSAPLAAHLHAQLRRAGVKGAATTLLQSQVSSGRGVSGPRLCETALAHEIAPVANFFTGLAGVNRVDLIQGGAVLTPENLLEFVAQNPQLRTWTAPDSALANDGAGDNAAGEETDDSSVRKSKRTRKPWTKHGPEAASPSPKAPRKSPAAKSSPARASAQTAAAQTPVVIVSTPPAAVPRAAAPVEAAVVAPVAKPSAVAPVAKPSVVAVAPVAKPSVMAVASVAKGIDAAVSDQRKRAPAAAAHRPAARPSQPPPPLQQPPSSTTAAASATTAAAAAKPAALKPVPGLEGVPVQYHQLAQALAQMTKGSDIKMAGKLLAEHRGDFHAALVRLREYHVDLEEARMMDQVRLASEASAIEEREQQRQAQLKEVLASDFLASARFSASALVRGVPQLSRLVQAGGEGKDAVLRLLEMEERAAKWYHESGRAFARHRAKELSTVARTAAMVTQEVERWQSIIYGMPSASGAPPQVFVDALQAEHRANGGILGNVTKEAQVEVVVLD